MELIDQRLALVELADRLKYLSNGSERKDGRMDITEIARYDEVSRCVELINKLPTICAVQVKKDKIEVISYERYATKDQITLKK